MSYEWFQLPDARPGTWRLYVSSADVPATHYIEGDSVRVVEVAVGAMAVVEIHVKPRQRKLLPLNLRPPPGAFEDAIVPRATPPLVKQDVAVRRSAPAVLLPSSTAPLASISRARGVPSRAYSRSTCRRQCMVQFHAVDAVDCVARQ